MATGARASYKREMAEGVGFEPTVRLPVRLISSQVPLTTQPPFQDGQVVPLNMAGIGPASRLIGNRPIEKRAPQEQQAPLNNKVTKKRPLGPVTRRKK